MSTTDDVLTRDAHDDSDDAGGGDNPDEVVPARRSWRPTRRIVALGAGVAVLLAAVTTAVVLAWNLRAEREISTAAQQATAAAQQYAVVLTSLDGAKLDSNFAAVLDGATGEFKDMYSQSSAQLKSVLIDNKAAAKGTVVAAGVKSATPERVEVMLFVDQSVTNSANPEPRVDRSRIIMTMENVDGRWLASNVEIP
ncbi:hypothetical protein [Mycobacterium sp. ACS4331]|uniref:hypothetical protein n=1 Tax=Mycobacterium sp. ACS4331 TaxID=1834121 RepID=UPI0007FF89F9|nr:hypothetical protein [Mycobacterium sp. ACS4331]OBF12029.1 hypothetical protein A5727_18575 [Mycobacterium sp. ACS4331]